MTEYDDLPFKVERWTKGYVEPEETIAMCADLLSANAAFEAAVKRAGLASPSCLGTRRA
jgi:hypothetical protein